MGILAECSTCKKRYSLKRKLCSCGCKIGKASGKTYWIEYYLFGKRKRERIGKSKAAAENRYREVQTAKAENRHIEKDPASLMCFGELVLWYEQLSEVKAKKSYQRDIEMGRHLIRILGDKTKIAAITPGSVEGYQQQRLKEPSIRIDKETGLNKRTAPSTVNKEVITLKTIFNRAIRHGLLSLNPAQPIKKLPENNVRMRVLEQGEFDSLVSFCPGYLRPIVITAYYTGMRLSEIVNLTWRKVDLQKGFIRLDKGDTKTNVGRSIPLHPEVKKTLSAILRAIHTDRVFLRNGQPVGEFKRSYNTAVKRAGIKDFTFHDLRHCAINNMRLAGNDYFRIMATSGHKTTSVFKRYNMVTESELSQMKWLDEEAPKKAISEQLSG